MAVSLRRMLRRKGYDWLKVIVITIFFWWLIIFGFDQELSSDFGEHLDRNRIEEVKIQKLKAYELSDEDEHKDEVITTMSPQAQLILNKFLDKLEATKKARTTTKSDESTTIFNEATTKVHVKDIRRLVTKPREEDSNVPAVYEKDAEESHEFWRPRNIFSKEKLGEQGAGVKMPKSLPPDIQKLYDDGWKKNSFNQYASDLISVHRSLPDVRSEYCKAIASKYSTNLPSTSVIIIFFNEAWSTLLRTVHSVLDRSPEHLIEEVILVDDCSEMDHLKGQLDEYMSKYPKVKILRTDKREGLIKARIRGAVIAKAPTMTFLDSHVECTEGWLEPLLDRVNVDPTNVPCPIIDIIDDITFRYAMNLDSSFVQVGGFDWSLVFRWHEVPERERKRKNDPWEPTQSPTMAGGLFTINSEFFKKLGMYDPGFDIWGGENLELSFKTWMCGGKVEIVPCSRVGHIFRSKTPYKWRKDVDVLRRNSIRLAEVWMDEYAQYFYDRTGRKKGDFGNITDRVKLREDLKCKSFKWYVENVYPELEIPSNKDGFGEIRNLGYGGSMCLDAESKKEMAPIIYSCHNTGGNQYWEYDKGVISRDKFCLGYNDSKLMIKACKDKRRLKSELWTFKNETSQLFNNEFSDECLTLTDDFKVVMEDCDDNQEGQKWKIENLYMKMVDNL